MRLSNFTEIRKETGKLIRLYKAGKIEAEKYKGILYGIQTLTGVMKAEREAIIELQLSKIETLLMIGENNLMGGIDERLLQNAIETHNADHN